MSVTGEWWITDGGEAIFADGDIGDCNHEGVVIDHLVPDLARLVDIEIDDDVDLQAFVEDFINLMDRRANENGTDIDVETDLVQTQLVELYDGNKDRTDMAWACVFSYSQDAREYACKYLGWIRVAGNTIQTQTLTRSQLRRLGDGLVDMYEEDQLAGEKWDVNVMGNRKIYYDVPTHVLLKGDPTGLLPYRESYAGFGALP